MRLIWEMNAVGEDFEQCVGDYMKRNDILDVEVEPFNRSTKICNAFVNIRFMFGVYLIKKALDSTLQLNSSDLTCVKSKISGPGFSKYLFKLMMYQATTSIPKEKIDKKVELMLFMDRLVNEFITQCKCWGKDLLLFNAIFNVSKQQQLNILGNQYTIEKDYCLKKYLFTNQLLQSSFNLTSYATFPSTFDPICAVAIIQPYRQFIQNLFFKVERINELPAEKGICFIEQIENSLVVEKLMAVSVAANYGMTDEDKKIEQQDFERMIYKLYASLKKFCQ